MLLKVVWSLRNVETRNWVLLKALLCVHFKLLNKQAWNPLTYRVGNLELKQRSGCFLICWSVVIPIGMLEQETESLHSVMLCGHFGMSY